MQRRSVRIITIIAAAACLLWIAGLGWAMQSYWFKSGTDVSALPAAAAEQTDTDKAGFTILALGDSLTRGIGDIEGKGYVGYAEEQLKTRLEGLSVINLGISGLTSPQLAEQVKEREVQRQIGLADVIVMTIGGNDLFSGGQTLSNLTEDHIDKLADSYLGQLNAVVTAIRALNAEAPVYVLGLYDPFSDLPDAAATSAIVRGWNSKTIEALAAYPNTVFVPTYDLFQRNVNDYLFTDHFHPNEKGYKLMADRLAALIGG